MAGAQPSPLNCGEAVEFTVYDFLKGIARREEHKAYPEPEVAMIFKKTETDNSVDLFEVEMGLRKAYKEVNTFVPSSPPHPLPPHHPPPPHSNVVTFIGTVALFMGRGFTSEGRK